ncbi:hypothetical protein GCM10009555_107460 [Acrocarpospora macrocephala]|uniref:G domain-containing protein n=1 Tax=Acrocarpospora macrocephala TaxID=150177 RepID=A0A5M3X9T6_9ACTN|nr:GTPase [Acrocarpospora macrocephala]GES16959.1 hypothetical protein Amac_105570 [Acrocarpospora macrocephala]
MEREFAHLVSTVTAELKKIVKERMHDLDSFNIVLFGRTGAGKSCLKNAFTGGDGTGASLDGKPDCTTKVQSERWGPIQVFDTPGIGGSMDQIDPEELEKARRTAASADVVVLCFDDSNQRALEFQTVARWIGDYQKVVVAVLNVKNPKWRLLHTPTIATQVADHVQHIREELARIGLVRVPVIALHAQNAMFANAASPYQGPHPQTCSANLAAYGATRLFDLSNMAVLEELLTELIRLGGAELRLGSTHRFVTASVARAASGFRRLREEQGRLVDVHERGIAETIEILGRPESEELLTSLTELERLRGSQFEDPYSSRAARFGDDLLASRLTPLERAAHERALTFIEEAMAARTTPAERAFEKVVFRDEEMEMAAEAALRDFHRFLERSFDVVVHDVYQEFKNQKIPPVHINAARGKWLYRAGIGSSVLGIGTTAGTVFAGFIAANIWNPLGWGALGVAVIAAVAGLAFGVAGEMSRTRATRERERALASARASAREAVQRMFTLLGERIAVEFGKVQQAVLAEGVTSPVADTIRRRAIMGRCADGEAVSARFHEDVPGAPHDPQRRAEEAVQACESRRGISSAWGRRGLWLGETLPDVPSARPSGPRDPDRPDVTATLLAFAASLPSVPQGVSRVWITEVSSALGDAALDRSLRELSRRTEPSIVFCGDYDSGKSSLISRLFGGTLHIRISSAPETRTVSEYRHWQSLTLVDTPGFQAYASGPSRETTLAIATASLVVLVFTPGLTLCDPVDLDCVLRGNPERAIPGRAGRTLLVVNRADSLGPDPEGAPAEFATLRERKLEQLRRDVVRGGHGVCLAAAPYGTSTPEPWDGMHEFALGLAGLREQLKVDHADVAVLSGGPILVAEYGARLSAEATELQGAIGGLSPAYQSTDRLFNEAAALVKERKEALYHRVGRLMDDLISRALSTESAESRNALIHRLEHLATDTEFVGIGSDWSQETIQKTATFLDVCERRLARQFDRPAARERFPELKRLSEARRLSRHAASPAAKASNEIGKIALVAQKVEKFALSGTPVARLVRGAGPALTLITGGISVYQLVVDLRGNAQHESDRTKAIKSLHALGDAWAEEAIETDAPLLQLAEHRDWLRSVAFALATELGQLESDVAHLRERMAACANLIHRAETLLGADPQKVE